MTATPAQKRTGGPSGTQTTTFIAGIGARGTARHSRGQSRAEPGARGPRGQGHSWRLTFRDPRLVRAPRHVRPRHPVTSRRGRPRAPAPCCITRRDSGRVPNPRPGSTTAAPRPAPTVDGHARFRPEPPVQTPSRHERRCRHGHAVQRDLSQHWSRASLVGLERETSGSYFGTAVEPSVRLQGVRQNAGRSPNSPAGAKGPNQPQLCATLRYLRTLHGHGTAYHPCSGRPVVVGLDRVSGRPTSIHRIAECMGH